MQTLARSQRLLYFAFGFLHIKKLNQLFAHILWLFEFDVANNISIKVFTVEKSKDSHSIKKALKKLNKTVEFYSVLTPAIFTLAL